MRPRNFTLAAGSLTLGLFLGLVLYLIDKWSDINWIDGLVCFVEIPAGIIVFTFVLEGIKKEIQKRT